MKNFLVIQTAFIGDAILATAVLEKLHQKFPNSSIDFVVRKGNESLFADHPFLNQVIVWNKQQGKYKSLVAVIKKVRGKRYDAVINLHRFSSSGCITWCAKANQKIGFDKNPFSFSYTKTIKHEIGNGKHETERNQKLIESFTDSATAKPKLYPTQKDYEATAQYQSQPYYCIAPTSVWFTKQYPANQWVDLANRLENKVYLLGSPADRDACEQIKQQSNNTNVTNLAGELTLLQSAALMQKAKMNFVNDSAPLHLASAVNASVTAVYCSTVPEFGFTPLSDNFTIVETSEKLSCRPCGLHGYKSCPEGHFKCATTIQAEQLYAS